MVETGAALWYNVSMKISNKKHDVNIAAKAVSAHEPEAPEAAANEAAATQAAPEGAHEGAAQPKAETASEKPASSGRRSREGFLVKLFTYCSAALFAVLFAVYAYFSKYTDLLSLLAPAASLLFFAAVTVRLIPRLVYRRDEAQLRPFGERSAKRLHPIVRIALFSLLMQTIVVIGAYIAHSAANGVDTTVFGGYTKLFAQPRGSVFGESTRTAVSSYGLLSFVIPQFAERLASDSSVYIPVLAVNGASIAASSVLLYELAVCDSSKRRAKFSVVLLHLLPSVILVLQPFSGTAQFFALCLLSLLLARRGKPLFAGIAAFLASLFSVFSVLLFVPVGIECLICARASASEADPASSRKCGIAPASIVIGLLLTLLPIALAFALRAAGLRGLFGFDSQSVFGMDAIGALIREWNGGAVSRAVICVSLAALILNAALIFFGAGSTRSSHTAFALAFTAVPAVLGANMALYGVFALPILAYLIGNKCTFRAARAVTGFTALVLLALFIVLLYIVKG